MDHLTWGDDLFLRTSKGWELKSTVKASVRLTHQPPDSDSFLEIHKCILTIGGKAVVLFHLYSVSKHLCLLYLGASCVTLNSTNAYMLKASTEKKYKLFPAIEEEYSIRRTVSGVSATSTQSSHH